MDAPVHFGARSLSGHELEGEGLMRLVYMDEAGISRDEDFATVGGVIVHGDTQLIPTERLLDRIADGWIPAPHREGFILHAHELFNGRGSIFSDKVLWPRHRRWELAEAFARVPERMGLRLALGAVDKRPYAEGLRLPEEYGSASKADRLKFLHAVAFGGCILGVENWMRKETPKEVCMLISEDNDQARSTIKEMIRAQQHPRAAEIFSEPYKGLFPLKKIREDPSFQPKRSSSVLQLADLWAYVAKKAHMQDAAYRGLWDLMIKRALPTVFQWEHPQ